MKQLVSRLYKSYGTYTNKSKMLPNIKDGLLPVQKRVLLGGHVICKNKAEKTAKVLGGVMANWHPHSEALGTAEWAVLNGFMKGEGSWGSRHGAEPTHCAAMRYTSMKANPFIEDLAFKYVDHVKWEEDELEPEPVSIPTMIPFCLMSKYELNTIAFGLKADIPCYEFKDLVKRLLWLITNEGPEPVIKPNLRGCKVLSSKKTLKQLLNAGEGEIKLTGTFTEDKSNNLIAINSWSPRCGFSTIMNNIDKYNGWNLLSNGDIGFRDESNIKNGTRCVFEVQKQRNVDKIYTQMKEAIEEVLKAKLRYKIYAVDENGELKEPGVDDMLLESYAYHKLAFNQYLSDTIAKIDNNINELNIISKIRPYISDEMKKSNDVDIICDALSKHTKLGKDDIKSVIAKHSIRKLMSVNTDISEIKKEKSKLEDTMKNITTYELESYKEYLK